MGTVTTGDAGTDASVTNSGTTRDAVFDFVIPRGDTGKCCKPKFLNAFSTPAQPGSDGSALLFDRNGASQGAAISHTAGAAEFTVQTPGNYVVSFHATLAPYGCAVFPLSTLIYLDNQGVQVPDTGVRHLPHHRRGGQRGLRPGGPGALRPGHAEVHRLRRQLPLQRHRRLHLVPGAPELRPPAGQGRGP